MNQGSLSAQVVSIPLGEELTIYDAARLKAEWFGLLDGAQGLELDLSMVQELDSAGVQLLMLLKREAEGQGKSLHLVNHSPAVIEVFQLLDLAGHFGDPMVITAERKKS